MEPTSTAAGSGYIATKIALLLGGFIGGLSLSAFWQPAVLREKGRLMAAAATGGISVGSAFVFGGAVTQWLGLNGSDVDIALTIGTALGISSVFLLNAVANYFRKKERADIFEVAQEIKSMRAPAKKAPARKRARKVAK